MDTTGLLYPFDPTGASPANLVENERQPINSPGIKNFYFILPKAGPFYANEAFEAVLFPSGRTLVEGVDYAFGHEFRAATRSTGIPVYGSIVFYDHRNTGNVRLKYQNVGGTWTLSEQKIAEILTNLTIDPRITTWEQVAEMPIQFPPTAHEWDIADMVGMSSVRDKLEQIADAILASEGEALLNHIADKENPHQVNKNQVGLALVQNMGLATDQAAALGTSNIGYMTPRLTQMTISALVRPIIDAHMADNNNPHGVTKAQIGLNLVENFPPATREQAENGTSNGVYLTPLTGRQLVAAMNQTFDNHIQDRGNPHGVTAAQTGAYSISEMDAKLTQYLTTSGTAANANRVYGMDLAQLLSNISQTPMSDALKFNGLTLAEVSTLVLTGTAANAAKFSGLTLADFNTSIANQIVDKVSGAVIPPVNTVKRLIGEVPDPIPDGWQPTFDLIELNRSYTKIARVGMRPWASDPPQDVMFGIFGGRSYVSTGRPGFSMVTLGFDRIVDANNIMTLENIAVTNINGAAAGEVFKLFYQQVDVVEFEDVDGQQVERPNTYLEIWLEDAKLRGPVICIDYSQGALEFLTADFPEFELDVQLVQPNGTLPVPSFKSTDALQTQLNTTITRTTALENRAGNIEDAIEAIQTSSGSSNAQLNARVKYVEDTDEVVLNIFGQMTAEIDAM